MLLPNCSPAETRREVRKQAILTAAHDLFLEKGYEATTLGDVVRRSGGSLATLYELFENKPGLLRALVTARCTRINEAIDNAVALHLPPREALRGISEHMFDKILDPQAASLFKAALAQPDLGPQLYQAGPAAAQEHVAEYLREQAAEGVLEVDDPQTASQFFFQLMFGHFHHKLIFGMEVVLTPDEKAAHIERVLTAFLRIYGKSDEVRGGEGEGKRSTAGAA